MGLPVPTFHSLAHEEIMAKTNFQYEKRQRELEKKRKAEEKARRKQEAKNQTAANHEGAALDAGQAQESESQNPA